MNKLVEIYCDGAAMAYRDIAKHMRQIIKDCPDDIKEFMSAFEPVATACEAKAIEVYNEAERFGAPRQ